MRLLEPTTQDLLALEAAVFTAWFKKDTVACHKWRDQEKQFKAMPPLLRIPSRDP